MLRQGCRHLHIVLLLVAACALPDAATAAVRHGPAVAREAAVAHDAADQLQGLLEGIPPMGTGQVYFHANDDLGKQLGALDPIADPTGGYLGVYHSPYWSSQGPTFRISLAHSDDLLHWTRLRVLDRFGASMPTLRQIPGTGAYLLAYEKKPVDANLIRIAYFRSRTDLLAGRAAVQRSLPRTLSPYANGTPAILWIDWRGSAARSLIGIGFHYQSEANRAPAADREAIGVLAGLRRWGTYTDDDADEALYGQGLQGNHGDWRQFSFQGYRWRVYEGQRRFDDFATWQVLLYRPGSGAVYPLSLHLGASRLTSVGNPIVKQLPAPGGGGEVLAVTAFVFGASSRALTGELLYYQPVGPGSAPAPGPGSGPAPSPGITEMGSSRPGPALAGG